MSQSTSNCLTFSVDLLMYEDGIPDVLAGDGGMNIFVSASWRLPRDLPTPSPEVSQ